MAKRPTTTDDAAASRGKAPAGTPPWEEDGVDPDAGGEDAPERDANTSDMFGDSEPAAASDKPRPYIVLARKYRPRTFEDLIGQEAMVTTLRNAFATDRIAQAYMLTGVRGVGKTTTARILARALNYSQPDAPGKPTVDMPGLGEHCAAIMESRHPDVLEMDAASNTGVDNVREIIEGARYRPVSARYRVYIIDEVHMLSKGAFNALLKTLEEPPEHVKFIFATTEIRKVPVTVLSRCQRFDLRRVGADLLVPHFARIVAAEGATAESDALGLIARAAEGSVRDGLSILDQAIAMGAGKVTGAAVRAMLGLADRSRVFGLIETVLGGDAANALKQLAALHKDGAEPLQLLTDLAETIHLAARARVAGPGSLDQTLSEEERQRAIGLAQQLSVPVLARAWQMLLKGLDEAGRAPDPYVAVEMLLIRMAHVADLPTPEELLKNGLPAGRPAARPGAGPGASPGGGGAERNGSARAQAAAEPPASPVQRSEPPPRPAAPPAAAPVNAPVDTFADVVALVGRQRDVRLKVHLEEHVSLVRYEPGQIDLFLLEGAPKELANELREKLNQWTGRKWMIALSRTAGAPPIGETRREKEAEALAVAMQDPLVQDLLKHFPNAEVMGLRSIESVLAPEAGEVVDSGDPEDAADDDEDSAALG